MYAITMWAMSICADMRAPWRAGNHEQASGIRVGVGVNMCAYGYETDVYGRDR